MNRTLGIGVGTVLVLLAGWLGYRYLFPPTPTVGSLIPPGALMVIASDKLQDTIPAQALRTEMSLRQVPVLDEARQRLDRFLYATADSAVVLEFLNNRDVRYSLHPVSKTTLDFIFYIPIANTSLDQEFIGRLTSPDPRQYRVLNHTFAGEKILDLVTRTNDPVGSFILTDQFVIASVSGILMENVAKRMHQALKVDQPEPGFQADADHLAGVLVRPQVLQALFGDVGSLVRLFLPEELNLEFRQADSRSHLVGYAVDKIGARRDVAALFAGQSPQRIQHPELIPQTTATLYHISVSDARKFGRTMSSLLGSASSDFLRDRFDQIEPATKSVYESLDNDVLLCRLESRTGALRQVMILTTKDLRKLATAYQQVSYLAGVRRAGAPKDYLGHKVLQLAVPELPASLFSSLFAGFPQSWITQHGSALVVASSEEAMQDYLQQVQRRSVWTADTRQIELVGTTLRPANFTALVRLNRAHTTVPTTWPLAWQNLLDQTDPSTGSTALSSLENMAYQASYGNENIQSTVILGRTTRRPSQAVLNKLLLQKRIELPATLTGSPIGTGNLSDSLTLFGVQTDGGSFRLVNRAGEQLAQGTTDGPMRSNVLAVDFLNNGRLQYLFMTDRKLYVIDPGRARDAKLVQSIALPKGINVTYLARPRGSQQRNLVALATHQDGHIYALDRQKRAFVPIMMAPRKGAVQLPFQIIPTASGMEILAMQADGTLNHWRENGSQYPHFPVKIERASEESPVIRFVGPAFQPVGQSQIQTITDEGELMTINSNGLIAKRTQLYRPVRSGYFSVFPDEDLTNWLLLLTTDTEFTVLSQTGERMFDVRALPSGDNQVRYHRLGAGIDLVSVLSGGFTSLYDLNGRLLSDRPIPGNFPVTLQFDERTNELYVLSGSGQTVQLFSIRLR